MWLFTLTNLLQRVLQSLLIIVEVIIYLFVSRYIYLQLSSNSSDNPLKDAFHKVISLTNTMEFLERTVSIFAAIACLACFAAQCIRPLRHYNHVSPDLRRGARMATHPTDG